MIIGVTGGIGSGKTYICKLLEIAAIPVFYSDVEAKRLMNSDFNV
ncbi:MAG: dephospho-CoA kinase, partial [Paludibacteraceae bacterium]|nr:dephospho-CoA kinase [Paludibacteraceae bacterium]